MADGDIRVLRGDKMRTLQDLIEMHTGIAIHTVIADIRNRAKMEKVFKRQKII